MFQPNMAQVDMNNNNGGRDDNNENNNNNSNNNNSSNNNNNNVNGGNIFGDDEFESANTNTTSENQEDGSDHQDPRPNKRKRYHRHTQHQIQEMEAFFKECPHPDDKQRKELSRQLGLDHLQIKFWFQNKRTQNKNQQERHENSQLRTENNKLRADNHRYREAIANALCPKCGGHTAIGEMSFEEHHLRLENARLTGEIHQLSALAANGTGKLVMNYPPISSPTPARPLELGMGTTGRDVYGSIENLWRSFIRVRDADKPLIVELAVGAMEELMTMARVGEPLWKGGVHGTSLALNLNEYTRTFRNGLGPRPNGFRTEASRETKVVFMHHMNIVERLMDVNLWSTMFARMVARAMTHEALFTGVNGSYDGAFHLMAAEYQVLSPLVSSRESYFVRYCKQQGDGLWAVVDVSIDHLVPNLELRCRRRPSGCLIQECPNGLSKVTWVEHVEVDDRGGVHNLYKHFITSGQALGANRWLATLDRQCERLATSDRLCEQLVSMMATSVTSVESDGLLAITNQAKMSIMKLAERMGRSFFSGLTASTADLWCNLSGYAGESIRLMTRKSLNDPGRPPGVIVCAATSFWVPVSHNTVFDFLKDENNRDNWDVLSNAGSVQRLSQITTGRDSRNCVSLIRSANTNQSKMMMIQESSTDPTASFVIYAPVDISAIEILLSGGDADSVALLPSGFAVLPDGTAHHGREGGSLVNVAFQILVEPVPSAKLTFSSVATIEHLIRETVRKINAFFHHQTA